MSVVIATFNRAPMLKRCLEQLACQDVNRTDYEVIVVNDGSTDVLLAGMDAPYSLRVLAEENAGQALALNAGVKLARSPYCFVPGRRYYSGTAPSSPSIFVLRQQLTAPSLWDG